MLALTEAREARDTSIQQAEDHVNRDHAGWSDQALAAVAEYALNADGPFMAEDVRRASDVPAPREPRAWGAVMQRAHRLKLITPAGFGHSRNKHAHLRPTALWRRP